MLFLKFLCFTVFSQWERVRKERICFARNQMKDKEIGIVFIIDAKVIVDGSSKYKVHNSKGKPYYVTANEVYVYVK